MKTRLHNNFERFENSGPPFHGNWLGGPD
jgi:hypothetical protein